MELCWRADLLRFTAYRTDKGSLDKGGLPQPAFLNFDASLLYPPAHTIQVGSMPQSLGPCTYRAVHEQTQEWRPAAYVLGCSRLCSSSEWPDSPSM